MGGMFSKKVKTPSLPSLPSTPAEPVVAAEIGEEQIKKARKKYGFEKTLFTGQLVPGSTGKKTTLG